MCGDFTITRVLNEHQKLNLLNTYIHAGLPPGTIMIQSSLIESVLNAEVHDYLYMCAKPGETEPTSLQKPQRA